MSHRLSSTRIHNYRCQLANRKHLINAQEQEIRALRIEDHKKDKALELESARVADLKAKLELESARVADLTEKLEAERARVADLREKLDLEHQQVMDLHEEVGKEVKNFQMAAQEAHKSAVQCTMQHDRANLAEDKLAQAMTTIQNYQAIASCAQLQLDELIKDLRKITEP